MLAVDDELQAECHGLKAAEALALEEKITGADIERYVVGVAVVVSAGRADGVLCVGLEKRRFEPGESAHAQDRVVGPAPERQVVAVDAAWRRALDLDLVEFFLDATRAAGGKFDPGNQVE